jgi:hypothetical protein
MPLSVLTCRLGSRAAKDPYAFSITRDGPPSGHPFAPSALLANGVLEAREAQRRGFRPGGGLEEKAAALAKARELEAERWRAFVPAYLDEMRASYRSQRPAWDALLARSRVVLACHCREPSRCHRTVLATLVLPRLGATYLGELASTRAGVDVELVTVAT